MRTFAVLLDLMTVVYLTRYSLKPMRLFGSLGALAGLGGIAFGIAAIAMKIFDDFHLNTNPFPLRLALRHHDRPAIRPDGHDRRDAHAHATTKARPPTLRHRAPPRFPAA